MTLIEIISDLKMVLQVGSPDTAGRVDDNNLKFKIDKYRMEHIHQLNVNNDDIADDFFQFISLEGLTLQNVNSLEELGEKVTVTPELYMASLIDNAEIRRISGSDRRNHIDFVSLDYLYTLLSIDDSRLRKIIFAARENDKLYFTNSITKIRVQYISTDPIGTYILGGKTTKEAWESRYPVDGYCAFRILLSILTRDFNLQTRVVADIISDQQDQFNIEKYGNGPRAYQPDVFASPEIRGRKASQEQA